MLNNGLKVTRARGMNAPLLLFAKYFLKEKLRPFAQKLDVFNHHANTMMGSFRVYSRG